MNGRIPPNPSATIFFGVKHLLGWYSGCLHHFYTFHISAQKSAWNTIYKLKKILTLLS